ncbi:hypothetical protein AAE478_004650 [Parahypoxylon ruwenzoriense]
MTRLLELSDEILLEILSYLQPNPPVPSYGRPFFCLSSTIYAENKADLKRVKLLYRVALACRRLYNIATSALYRHIPLTTDFHRSCDFVNAMREQPHLLIHVRSIDILASMNLYPLYLPGIFWLPNLHTICLRNFNGLHGWFFYNQDHVRTSPVQILRLIDCGARGEALSQVLSWPKSLKELYYEAEEAHWEEPYRGAEAPRFSCAAVERAMAIQADCLEKLVFTRSARDKRRRGHPGAGHDILDVRRYKKLKSLCTDRVFLEGPYSEEDTKVWEHVPESLQELEVDYDRFGYVEFLGRYAREPGWLLGILDRMATTASQDNPKGIFTPSLERVRVISLEWKPLGRWDDEEEESQGEDEERMGESAVHIDERRGQGNPESNWRPPAMLMQKFIKAGVSFSIYLRQRKHYRYVVEGGKGFRDTWEDTWGRHQPYEN